MSELFLEVYSEEIPAGLQVPARDSLTKILCENLANANLEYDKVESYVTTQRLVFSIDGLPVDEPLKHEERKGPRTSAPQKAIDGFLRGLGGSYTIDDCHIKEDKKGTYYSINLESGGGKTKDSLGEIVKKSLSQYTWAKSMKWFDNHTTWVRPIRGIAFLFDGEIVDMNFGGVQSSNTSYGHRFISKEKFTIKGIKDYKESLKRLHVIIDQEERKRIIVEGSKKIAQEHNLTLIEDQDLIVELAGLNAYPNPLLGTIDAEFMEVPEEVLLTSMKSHQKYLGLRDQNGKMAPHFIVITNSIAPDGGKEILLGNERVLRARLSDAKFFWDNDLKTSLDEMNDKLSSQVYHDKIGTMGQRIRNIEKLARNISFKLNSDVSHITQLTLQAASYCKVDLTSEVVFEFPEVQGIMGGYYAERAGFKPQVVKAIKEHYSPRSLNDSVPTGDVSIAIALADKFNTLASFWSVNEKPTGSKDPYALRRCAIGIIRIIVENELRIDIFSKITRALDLLIPQIELRNNPVSQKCANNLRNSDQYEAVTSDLVNFIMERMRIVLEKTYGIRYDVVNACIPRSHNDLGKLHMLSTAVNELILTEDGKNLMAGYLRANNILIKEQTKDNTLYEDDVNMDLLEKPEEIALVEQLNNVSPKITKTITIEDYESSISLLATLKTPIDEFMTKIIVNDKNNEIRINRLHILNKIVKLMRRLANFNEIEVK